MSIDPDSIDRWLRRDTSHVPDFKRISERRIHEIIETTTGKHFKISKGGPLWDHQLRALCAALYFGRSLSFLEPRLGKTRVTLEWASHLRRCGMWQGPGIVIVPSPTVLGVWRMQIPEYTSLHAIIVRSGSNDEFLTAVEKQPDLVVVAWSALQQLFSVKKLVKPRGKERRMKLVIDWDAAELAAKEFTLSTIDEIHYCKTPSALTTKIGMAITAGHKWKLGLTGTPFGRFPDDLWAQGMLIDDGNVLSTSQHFFQVAFGKRVKRYFGNGGFEYKFDKTKLPLLANKLHLFSIAYEFKEVRTATVERRNTQLVMKGEQLAIYNRILERIRDKHVLGKTSQENTFIRLRQISSGHDAWIDEDGHNQISTLPDHTKLRWLRSKIAAGRFQTQSILFYHFIPTGLMLARELRRAGIPFVWIRGGVTKGRDEMIASFQSREATVFLSNLASGSVGIDLSAADYMAFVEGTPSPAQRQQAEMRPMAASRGSRKLLIEDVVASPMDQHVLDLANEGKDMVSKGLHSGREFYDLFKIR